MDYPFRKNEVSLEEIRRIRENEAQNELRYRTGIGIERTVVAAVCPPSFVEWRSYIISQLKP